MKQTSIAAIGAVLLSSTLFAATQATPPPGQTAPPKPQTPATPPPLVPKPAPPPFPAGAMIAYVQFQAVVQESKLGKCGQDAMKKFQDDNAPKLQAKQKEAQTLQSQITAQTGVVTEARLSQMNRDLDKLSREFQAMSEQFKSDQEALNEDLLGKFRDQVLPIVESLRAEKGLWAIFTVPDSNMAAANPGLDLSLDLVKKLDEKFPVCK